MHHEVWAKAWPRLARLGFLPAAAEPWGITYSRPDGWQLVVCVERDGHGFTVGLRSPPDGGEDEYAGLVLLEALCPARAKRAVQALADPARRWKGIEVWWDEFLHCLEEYAPVLLSATRDEMIQRRYEVAARTRWRAAGLE